jgi:CO/xanthine dehydrogenase FAD-binding subunit
MLDPGRYYRVSSLRAAVRLARLANLAALADGEYSLSGVLRPLETVVDMKSVPEMRRQTVTESGLVVGAEITLREFLEHDELLPAMRDALTRAVPRHLWGYLTLRETLNARHHPMLREWLAALMALNICVERLEFDAYEPRWDEVERLIYTGLLDDGLITALLFPTPNPDQRLAIGYVAASSLDPACISAAVLVNWHEDHTVIESARIVVCGASAEPVILSPEWLIDQPFCVEMVNRVIDAINHQLEVGSSRPCLYWEQRQVMVERCVQQAFEGVKAA